MATDKYKKESNKKNPHFKLELGEELNLEPRLRPSKTGSVSQNTSKPIGSHKNHKDK